MSTIRFVCRGDKPGKFGKCPIEIIYQISGQRKKSFTDYKVNPINWNSDDQAAVYLPEAEAKKILKSNKAPEDWLKAIDQTILLDSEVKELNGNLAGISKSIRDIEKKFEANEFVYNTDDVIATFKEKKTGKVKKVENKVYLLEFVEQFINDHSATRERGTIETYKALQGDLKTFQAKTQEKLKFESIDYGFFQRFQNYLVKTDTLNNSTISKKLSILKTMLGYARKSGITIGDGYRDFILKRAKIEVIALTQEEFDQLLEKDFSDNKKLGRVRDVFCFSCATGLRMSDMAQLRREHIKGDFINLVIKKTKTELTIPLNRISASILNKYQDQALPLPIISNQKLNEYIKDACKLAEINEPIEIVRFKGSKREATVLPKHKLIHVHTGRKTFVTLSLEKGMSAEQVMAITGHTDYKSFKKYVDITKKLSRVVMVKAWGEVQRLKAV